MEIQKDQKEVDEEIRKTGFLNWFRGFIGI
jgi:hypothetical protein